MPPRSDPFAHFPQYYIRDLPAAAAASPSTSGGGGKVKNKRRRAGLDYSTSLHSRFFPKSSREGIRQIHPLSPHSINEDAEIRFFFKTGPEELVRLLPRPIRIRCEWKLDNPDYDDSAQFNPATNNYKETAKHLYWSPIKKIDKHGSYVGASTPYTLFFQGADIQLNGDRIEQTSGGLRDIASGMYQACQGCFMSQSEIEQYYGSNYDIATAEQHHAVGDTTVTADTNIKRARENLTFSSSQSEYIGRTRIYQVGMDSFCLLGNRTNHTLAKIEGRSMREGNYLPPNTAVMIVLRRALPFYRYVESSSISDGTYFSGAAAAAASIAELKKVKQVLHSVTLTVESVKLKNPAAYLQYDDRLISYYHDLPDLIVHTVPFTFSSTETVFLIPPYTRLVYVSFLYNSTNTFIESLNKNQSFRMRVPDSLRSMRFEWEGEPLHFLNGLRYITGADKANIDSETRTEFESYLKMRNLNGRSMEDFFPPSGCASYCSCIPLDLTKMQWSGKYAVLKVSCTFETAAPQGAFLFGLGVREWVLRGKGKAEHRRWTLAPVHRDPMHESGGVSAVGGVAG